MEYPRQTRQLTCLLSYWSLRPQTCTHHPHTPITPHLYPSHLTCTHHTSPVTITAHLYPSHLTCTHHTSPVSITPHLSPSHLTCHHHTSPVPITPHLYPSHLTCSKSCVMVAVTLGIGSMLVMRVSHVQACCTPWGCGGEVRLPAGGGGCVNMTAAYSNIRPDILFRKWSCCSTVPPSSYV